MTAPRSLTRQVAVTMTTLVLVVVLLVMAGSYAFYAVLMQWAPETAAEPEGWMPTTPEWVWMGLAMSLAVMLALWMAVKLARSILAPLDSVATSLRQLAQGDLSARAVPGPGAMDETAELARDFNHLAEKLQRMTQDQQFWNAAIAHELRTPVTILRGRLQGLADGVFQPEHSQFESLLAQVEGLTRLIEDLRVVGLADSGHLPLRVERVPLADVAATELDGSAPLLRQHGFRVDADLGPGEADADPVRIRQALRALLHNATQHATPGPLHVRVRVDAGGASLSVQDEGPGLAPGLASHVFEAFRRGDGGREQGSGLGLAVVRAIAQAHGGSALCEAVGGGTRFSLRWPARRATPEAAAAPGASEATQPGR